MAELLTLTLHAGRRIGLNSSLKYGEDVLLKDVTEVEHGRTLDIDPICCVEPWQHLYISLIFISYLLVT